LGIDNKGGVTGYYSDKKFVTHGFVRTAAGRIKTFDLSGSTYTRPQAIGAGVAAGYYNDSGNVAHGFVRSR
jgi:hypothetical protein